VQALLDDDASYVGANLAITDAALQWDPAGRTGTLNDRCEGPSITPVNKPANEVLVGYFEAPIKVPEADDALAYSIHCRAGSFGPGDGSPLLSLSEHRIALPWYDNGLLILEPARTDAPSAEPTYSATYSGCIDAAGGANSAMTECEQAERARWDAELNARYQLLMRRLPGARAQSLRDTQRAWIKTTRARCEHAGDENAGGTAQHLEIASCYMQETAKQVRVLRRERP
jgi:uncharacterized protein YecT (DUF1311 family)